jgi:metal-dependent hydrolase (beta-lactamase superfamily II)
MGLSIRRNAHSANAVAIAVPIHQAWRGQSWEPDPLILDDQALIAHVAGRGLVVLTGCGHAGIINICRYAQRLTGVEKALEGKLASAESIEAATRNAGAKLEEVNSDIHASAEYRRAMVAVFSERALKGALARVG